MHHGRDALGPAAIEQSESRLALTCPGDAVAAKVCNRPCRLFDHEPVCPAQAHHGAGVREAVVSAQLFEAGQLEIDFETVSDEGGSHPIPGWFFDPYDPEFEDVVLNSVSDDVKYDEMFPGHPLTELRRVFENVRGTTVVEALFR